MKVPTIKVKNEVVWANKKLKLPFKIEKGKPTDLGMLLSLDQSNGNGFKVDIREDHGRSAEIGKVIFEDDEGRKYRDIDVKGIGLSGFYDGKLSAEQWYTEWERFIPGDSNCLIMTKKVMGLFNLENAIKERDLGEEFTKYGIRTSRVIALIRLNELNVGHELIKVKDAKKRELIVDEFNPAVIVRAFGVDTRISDLDINLHQGNVDKAKLDIHDAISLIYKKHEVTMKDLEDYVSWFAASLGESIGIMHRRGYFHQHLHPQNITLDCRITDFEDVVGLSNDKKEREEQIIKDFKGDDAEGLWSHPGALESLRYLVKRSKMIYPKTGEAKSFDTNNLDSVFLNSYQSQFVV